MDFQERKYNMKKERLAVKDSIVMYVYKTLRMAIRIFWIFPIKRNRILFQSHDKGQGYNCNPKYICECLKKEYPDEFEIIWAFAEPGKFKNIAGIIPVKLYSIKWLYYCMTAHIIMSNVNLQSFIPKRKKQLMIETWHGHPYKRVGLSIAGIGKRQIWSRRIASKNIDLFVSCSKHFEKFLIEDSYRYSGKILKCGQPRNDILLDQKLREETAGRVRRKLKLDGYVVLFAPTFRKNGRGESAKNIMPYKEVIEALERRMGKKVYFLVHSHHWDRKDSVNVRNVIDVSDYPDIQELYCASDMLITDYSSCMWDFALLYRPCLLYVPDWEEYKNEDRGIYGSLEDWPGLLCYDKEELIEAVNTLDNENCAQIARRYFQISGCYESGTASSQVCKWIKEMKENH